MAGQTSQLHSRKGNIAIIAVFVVVALFMIAATHYGTKTLSAVRAYVGAESEWTKAQKKAVDNLIQYSVEQDPRLYQQFNEELEFPLAFKKARKTLISARPDYNRAFKEFEKVDIHPEDIDLLVWLGQFHNDISYLDKAFEIWKQGDQLIARLDSLGRELHKVIQADQLDSDKRNQYLRKISSVDQTLTKLESSFSATMSEGARWIRKVLFWSIVILGAIVIFTGYLVTERFFRNINDLNRELRESENKFRTVLDHSRDAIYQMDYETGEYEYLSPAVENMLGFSPETVLAEGPEFILNRVHPEDQQRMEQEVQNIKGESVEEQLSGETEFRIKTKAGDYIWVNNQRSLVRDGEGNPTAIVGTVRDVTARKEHEVQVEKSLKEKQTLLAEIHHRVKNNLAVISGLLEMQRDQSDNQQVQKELKDAVGRVQSFALVHEQLYKEAESDAHINLHAYLPELANTLKRVNISSEQEVHISVEAEEIDLPLDQAVSTGLIISELLTNAFKHAFREEQEGHLEIKASSVGNDLQIQVIDDGVGLPENFSFSSGNMGLQIVNTLLKQLEAEISFDSKPGKGTMFNVMIPLNTKS